MLISRVTSFHKLNSISKGNSKLARDAATWGSLNQSELIIDNLRNTLSECRTPTKSIIKLVDLDNINRFIVARLTEIINWGGYIRNTKCRDVGVAIGISYSCTKAARIGEAAQLVIDTDTKPQDININVKVALPNGKYTTWSLTCVEAADHVAFLDQYWD